MFVFLKKLFVILNTMFVFEQNDRNVEDNVRN